MSKTTLFDASYEPRKQALLGQVLARLEPIYAAEDLEAIRIDPVNPEILAQRSGRGFVNRDILETVLGNLLECVVPGSHNALDPAHQKRGLAGAIGVVADQVYAMVAQSLLAAGEEGQVEEKSLMVTFALLWDLPRLKERAWWNRFASLRDPAAWDAYLLRHCGLSEERLVQIDFAAQVEATIRQRDGEVYRRFLEEMSCGCIFEYQMQLVMSTYPGWRVLFYHDIAHALTRAGEVAENPALERLPVPLLPRAIAELGGRYYQADLHPETRIGDANFLDHPHRGLTTGQTGVIGSGCHLLPCTLGGLSTRVQQRHPILGDYVVVGTDANVFGPVYIGDHSVIGPNTEIYGLVEVGTGCHIGSSVVVGTVKTGERKPGRIRLGQGVRVGDGTIIENSAELDLVIPDKSQIPARSHVANDGFGHPRLAG